MSHTYTMLMLLSQLENILEDTFPDYDKVSPDMVDDLLLVADALDDVRNLLLTKIDTLEDN